MFDGSQSCIRYSCIHLSDCRIGITIALFHISGKTLWFHIQLNNESRQLIAFFGSLVKRIFGMPSGPGLVLPHLLKKYNSSWEEIGSDSRLFVNHNWYLTVIAVWSQFLVYISGIRLCGCITRDLLECGY